MVRLIRAASIIIGKADMCMKIPAFCGRLGPKLPPAAYMIDKLVHREGDVSILPLPYRVRMSLHLRHNSKLNYRLLHTERYLAVVAGDSVAPRCIIS
jgi:hypothetical protein